MNNFLGLPLDIFSRHPKDKLKVRQEPRWIFRGGSVSFSQPDILDGVVQDVLTHIQVHFLMELTFFEHAKSASIIIPVLRLQVKFSSGILMLFCLVGINATAHEAMCIIFLPNVPDFF